MTEEHVLCSEAECGCKRVTRVLRLGDAPAPVDHPRGPECHPGVEDLEQLQARWDRVHELRATLGANGKPLTLQAIGEAFDPPMTRQRVNQLLGKARPESAGGARRST